MKKTLLILVLPLFLHTPALGSGFSLTLEEREYLDSIRARPVSIAYSYDIMNRGMLDPMLNVLKYELGLHVDMIKMGWREGYESVESGDVDFYALIAIGESRRKKYITVGPLYRNNMKIVTRKDAPVRSLIGLYNRPIGLLEGSTTSQIMLTYIGPKGKIRYFSTMDDMIKALQNGDIDAFATGTNIEFEILSTDDIGFEFCIDNFYIEQGFIGQNEDKRMLADILNRYIEYNPKIIGEIENAHARALVRFSKERMASEIAYLQENYDEILFYADLAHYPLLYREKGEIKGMLMIVNDYFESLTGIPINFVTDDVCPSLGFSNTCALKSGEISGIVGAYYDVNTHNDPDLEYSPVLWYENLRLYSYQDITDLKGKTVGASIGTSNMTLGYLGWNNMIKNTPLIYNNYPALLRALRSGEVDMAFMGVMRFNYGYSVLKDYRMREVPGISAEATLHVLYGIQNKEFNALYNEAIALFHVLSPMSVDEWKQGADRYKQDLISMRYIQRMGLTITAVMGLILATIIAVLLYHLFRKTKRSLKIVQKDNRELLDKVYYDALTGIFNRRYLDKQLKRIIQSLSRSGGMLTVMMVDVDFFKQYNDTYGHDKGDECLRVVASVLAYSLHRAGDFVARYGGEEFAVVLSGTDPEGARKVAEDLLQNIRDCNILHENSRVADMVTISIGVTTCVADHTQSPKDYTLRADKALYEAKQGGRNRYVFIEC